MPRSFAVTRTVLSVLALAACGGGGPTEPSRGPSTPGLGVYRAAFTFRSDFVTVGGDTVLGQPDSLAVTITVTSASPDSIDGTVEGALVAPQAILLGFWFEGAYIVAIGAGWPGNVDLRLNFSPSLSCSGMTQTGFGGVWKAIDSCLFSRVPG